MNSINKVLIDTSVWIEYFRSGSGKIYDTVDILLDVDRVILCGIVEMEILQGLRPKERSTLKELFSAIDYADIIREDYVNAGNILNLLRIKGITIPSSDAIIAALCIRVNCELLTLDKHFDYIEKIKKIEI